MNEPGIGLGFVTGQSDGKTVDSLSYPSDYHILQLLVHAAGAENLPIAEAEPQGVYSNRRVWHRATVLKYQLTTTPAYVPVHSGPGCNP
jgi:hypothetical protein